MAPFLPSQYQKLKGNFATKLKGEIKSGKDFSKARYKLDFNIKNNKRFKKKKGKLDMDEIQWMRSHTEEGIAIIKDLKHYNEEVVKMAAQHHESFDGKGYPYALASDKISYFSRVCKVADVYESLTSPVVYRKAMKPLDALTIMTRDMKSMFDPKVLRNFITLLT